MTLRSTFALLAGLVAAALTAPAAHAAAPPAGPTPLAFTDAEPFPCPAAADVSGQTASNGVARVFRASRKASSDAQIAAMLVVLFELGEPATLAAICDPGAAAARRPLAPFGGILAPGKLHDVVDRGLRAIQDGSGAEAGLQPGDRLELPPSVGAQVDVGVRTPEGLVTSRLGPFTTSPVRLTVAGTPAAPVVHVDLADGSSADLPVAAPRSVRTRLRITTRGRRLRLDVRAWPGSVLIGTRPLDDLTGEEVRGAFEASGAAGPHGRATVTSSPLHPNTKRFEFLALDVVHRRSQSWNCRLRWRGAKLRRATCNAAASRAGVGKSEPLARGALAALTAHARRALQANHPHISAGRAREARRASAAGAADALAGRRTTLTTRATVPIDTSTVVSDLTGDGLPDLVAPGNYDARPTAFVSSPGGWRRARVTADDGAVIAPIPDVNGDGLDDLWTSGARTVAGRSSWSTGAARPTIDLRKRAPLGSLDLRFPDLEFADDPGDIAPRALPDSTGDTRPELLITSMIFASQALRFGRATRFSDRWTVSTAAHWTELVEAVKHDDDDADDASNERGTADSVFTAPSSAPLVVSISDSGQVRLTSLPTGEPWTLTGAAVKLGTSTVLQDGDAARGEVLVRTTNEGCVKLACTTRIRRVDREGRVIATASIPDIEGSDWAASYVADGPDADDQPEVLLLAPPVQKDDVDVEDGPLMVWSSMQPTVDSTAFAPLVIDGKPVRATALGHWREHGAPRGVLAEELGEARTALSLLELAP